MTPLIQIDELSLSFGPLPTLDKVKLIVHHQERICLIGRNGAGKSSLLKIIEGSLQASEGRIWRAENLKIARLEQTLPYRTDETVYEFVAAGLSEMGETLAAYHQLTQSPSPNLNQLETLQRQIDAQDAWQFDTQLQTILTQLQLDANAKVASLSGGWQRRVALARALVKSPDLLLLDEPTNHLDIEGIEWLENVLRTSNISLMFITHDRALLQRLATRIIEIDEGKLTSWPGDYSHFLEKKAALLEAEEKANALFDKRLAQEEKWIRQGIKARRTRNEGRVRALKAMREERKDRREREKSASFNLSKTAQSGQLVIEALDITHTYKHSPIIRDFSARIMRGDRIGLIGPNGSGKSTLLNLLLGKLTPTAGTVRLGTQLSVAYFEQNRASLDLEATAIDNVREGSDFIELNGQKKHIHAYLADFLFTPQRAMTPVKYLSGGECNRLLLAKLFTKPANLLVMDEPTNDLDIETLELLESLLCEFKGTLLLVSHDRTFLNHVVTSTFSIEPDGQVIETIGDYDDWLKQRPIVNAPSSRSEPSKKTAPSLSATEKNLLKRLPKQIEDLEAKIETLQSQMGEPGFYEQSPAQIELATRTLNALNIDLEAAFEQWEALEKKKGG